MASRIAAESGQTLSDVVRMALDEYLQRRRRQRKDFLDALENASGIWRGREDIPDSATLRQQVERLSPWQSEH